MLLRILASKSEREKSPTLYFFFPLSLFSSFCKVRALEQVSKALVRGVCGMTRSSNHPKSSYDMDLVGNGPDALSRDRVLYVSSKKLSLVVGLPAMQTAWLGRDPLMQGFVRENVDLVGY